MQRNPTFKLLGVMACAIGIQISPAAAQSVILGLSSISVRNATGATATIDQFGTINLGSNGSGGNLRLRDPDGTIRMDLVGSSADLFLGGGNDDGDIRLRDTDGVTTTIDLDGQLGLITLGSVDDDGDLWVMDNDPDGLISIGLDGGTGDVTNQLGGNGLVKAWARINANGSVHSCWRCSVSETVRLGAGVYLVSFSPLATDIRSRPRLATLDAHGFALSTGQISVGDGPAGNNHRIRVDTENSSGDSGDRSFTVFVF